MKNKKGLSQVVTTVIFVSLALIAIGIVWAVINNMTQEAAGETAAQFKCIDVDVRANAVVNTSATAYDVTLKRAGGGDEIAGVKMVLHNETGGASGVIDSAEDLGTAIENIEPLATVNAVGVTGVENANRIEITPYVTDDAGNEVTCTTTEFKF